MHDSLLLQTINRKNVSQTFVKIVYELETDPNFITENVDENEYKDYMSLVKDTHKYSNIRELVNDELQILNHQENKKAFPKSNQIMKKKKNVYRINWMISFWT